MSSVGGRKEELRQYFKKARLALDPELKKKWDHEIATNVAKVARAERGDVWSIYSPINAEVDPNPLIKMYDGLIEWAYPIIQNQIMKFRVSTQAHEFVRGGLGILEPHPDFSREIQEFAVCIVPGLAFDTNGHRLGSGKGYYDRFLATYEGLKVGLAYESQISESPLPSEKHDTPVDYVVTEKRILKRKE